MILAASLLVALAPAFRVGTTWEYEYRSSYQVSADNDPPVDVWKWGFRVTSLAGSDVRVKLTQTFVETIIGEAHVPPTSPDALSVDLPWTTSTATDWKALLPNRPARWALWFLLAARDQSPPPASNFRDAKPDSLSTITAERVGQGYALELVEPLTEYLAQATLKLHPGNVLPRTIEMSSTTLQTPGGNLPCRWTASLKLVSFKR